MTVSPDRLTAGRVLAAVAHPVSEAEAEGIEEVELRGDDIGGIAVHIGARVMSLGEPGDVIVSSTVKDLAAGSGISFDDRGEHTLKGVPDTWRVFAVASGSS